MIQVTIARVFWWTSNHLGQCKALLGNLSLKIQSWKKFLFPSILHTNALSFCPSFCLSVCQSVCLSVCLSPPYPPPPPPPLQPFCSSHPLLGLSKMFLDQASLLGRGLDRGQCPVEHSGEILSVHLSMYMSLRTFSPSWEAGPGCSKAIKKLAQSPIGSTALPSRRSNVSKWAGQGYCCSYDAFG